MDGWVNVDHSVSVRSDLCGSLSEVLGVYGPDAFSAVLLKHVFEHVQDQIGFMEQLYAVCAPDARVFVHCPYYSSADAWSDPDHKHAISENTFFHFDRSAYLWEPGNPITAAHSDSFLPACDFELLTRDYVLYPEWYDKTPEEKEFACKHYNNVVAELRVLLRCVKPGRTDALKR